MLPNLPPPDEEPRWSHAADEDVPWAYALRQEGRGRADMGEPTLHISLEVRRLRERIAELEMIARARWHMVAGIDEPMQKRSRREGFLAALAAEGAAAELKRLLDDD